MLKLAEVLEYGMIGAVDEDTNCLVTINGVYLNFWASRGDGTWENTTCSYRTKDMYETTAAKAWDECKAYLAEVLKGDDE